MLNTKKLFTKILQSLNGMLPKSNVAMGRVSVGQIAANSYGDVTITHNLGSNARVVAVLFSSGTSSTIGSVCVALEAKTANTATFRVFNDRSSTINPALEWIAINK